MGTRIRCMALILMLTFTLSSRAAGPGGELLYPAQIPDTTWLQTHQRLCFGVDPNNLDEVIHDGTNVICGGTNAAGIGFAGGPFILGKDGEVIDVMTGKVVPEKTITDMRGRVNSAHAKGAKVVGEVIRFWVTIRKRIFVLPRAGIRLSVICSSSRKLPWSSGWIGTAITWTASAAGLTAFVPIAPPPTERIRARIFRERGM